MSFHVSHSAADWPQVEWGSIWCVGKDGMRRGEKISGRKLMEKQDEKMGDMSEGEGKKSVQHEWISKWVLKTHISQLPVINYRVIMLE